MTVVTTSFSKGFRLYTKRVGYALLPDELVMPLRIVQQHTLLTHDPVTQHAMIEALGDLDNYGPTHPAVQAHAKLGRTMMDNLPPGAPPTTAIQSARAENLKPFTPNNGG